MRTTLTCGGVLLAMLWAGDAAALQAPGFTLSEADKAKLFRAAGAIQRGGRWVMCVDDPAPAGASIERIRDLNGDGRPEVVVREDGTHCYGRAGMAYRVLSRQARGVWRLMASGSGIPEFLKSRGKGGWPDIVVGGPGRCFPVERWNGKTYTLHRFEYQGKRCKPQR